MRTKSRPNIQNPPANFDEVKRRFIRQNRELAKANSTQSLRIRSLELDVSRLLDTNLELRQEVLLLRSEVQDARRQSCRDGVRGFKEEMAAKIKALSDLVSGIEEEAGAQDEREAEADERKREALEHMDFRERQPLVEVMRECQMPAISEDHVDPRRTLDGQEIKAIRLSDHSNESPDLGPPPIARFDYEDPIKFNSQPVPDPTKTTEDEELPASLSVNLETRRKRKDGQPKLELRRSSILPPPSPSQTEGETTAPTLRLGAKRKLADRDLDKPARAPSKTDFTFSRKVAVEPAHVSEEEPPAREDEDARPVDTAQISPQRSRKVLGDKSTNMSPRKTAATVGKPEKDDLKKPAAPKPAPKDRASSRRSRLSNVQPPPPAKEEVVVATIEPPADSTFPSEAPAAHPTTPAVDDMFSPTPSEPSARPAGSRDTPPPSDLANSLAASGIEGARPSRRARAAVNYAEPSLIAKMRRPEKKMLDAVNGLQDHRRAMNSSVERKSGSGRQVVIKKEPEDEDAWKNLPAADETVPSASPLTHKSAETNDESALQHQLDSQLSSAPPAAIERLVQDGRIRQRDSPTQQSPTADAELDAAAKKLQELDIYDFKDSSSPSSTASSSDLAATKPPAPKSHRRHSSIPKDVLSKASPPVAPRVVEHGVAVDGGAAKGARVSSRRRSMML